MPGIKKVVIKVDMHDNNDKRKVLKAISTLSGIESLTVELKDQKLTLTGEMDPICLVNKLNKRYPSIRGMMGGAKNWHASIVSVEPVKEDKKDGGGDKKDKGDDKKSKDDAHYKKWMEENKPWMYTNYPHVITPQYYVREENPSGCFMW